MPDRQVQKLDYLLASRKALTASHFVVIVYHLLHWLLSWHMLQRSSMGFLGCFRLRCRRSLRGMSVSWAVKYLTEIYPSTTKHKMQIKRVLCLPLGPFLSLSEVNTGKGFHPKRPVSTLIPRIRPLTQSARLLPSETEPCSLSVSCLFLSSDSNKRADNQLSGGCLHWSDESHCQPNHYPSYWIRSFSIPTLFIVNICFLLISLHRHINYAGCMMGGEGLKMNHLGSH